MFQAPAHSDLLVDRYLAGELAAADRAAFEARLAQEPSLRARVDELRAGRAAFAVSAPSFAAVVETAASDGPAWRRVATSLRARIAGAGVLAAAAAGLFLSIGPVDDDGTRPKGGRFVAFVVERDGQQRAGGPGFTLHPGDRVQFVVDAGAGAFVGVWSKDGAGAVSAYAPPSGGLERAAGQHRFDNSTRLDDVVGPEVFVGVRCAAPVDDAAIAAAVAKGTALAGCDLDRVAVTKERRP